MDIRRRKLVVQSGPPRTSQFETEAEYFQGGEGDRRRDEEMEGRVVSTQVKSRTESRLREVQPGTSCAPEQRFWNFPCPLKNGRPPWGSVHCKVFNRSTLVRSSRRRGVRLCSFVVLKRTSFNLVRTVFMSPLVGR